MNDTELLKPCRRASRPWTPFSFCIHLALTCSGTGSSRWHKPNDRTNEGLKPGKEDAIRQDRESSTWMRGARLDSVGGDTT